MFCKYKDIFGKPGQGIHARRFLNVAIMDVLGTIIGAVVISFITKYKFLHVLLFLFLLGILCHRLFCVRTTIDKLLF